MANPANIANKICHICVDSLIHEHPMSKLAKKPIAIPEGAEVKESAGVLEIKGKGGLLIVRLLPFISAELRDKTITIKASGKHKQARANWGTNAALIKNALTGVTGGFNKMLEIEGIGFRATLEGNSLILNVGLTHPVKYAAPDGVKLKIEKGVITVSGADKSLVGLAAAQIRKIKPPEPYKGTGIHYRGEVIRRKHGKKVAGAATAA